MRRMRGNPSRNETRKHKKQNERTNRREIKFRAKNISFIKYTFFFSKKSINEKRGQNKS